MVSTIGLKIANGEFYSILEENSPVKKRLVLTTVHDNQHSVQIDLYKSYTRTMTDAQYIGSLVMESITPRPKGEPSIELVISSSENGVITADAVDLDTSVQGEHHVLNVSLKSMDEINREYEIPDFELESNETPPTGLYGKAHELDEEEKEKRKNRIIVICLSVILFLLGLTICFLLLRGTENFPDIHGRVKQFFRKTETTAVSPPAPQPVQQTPSPTPSNPAPAQTTTPPPVIQAPTTAPAVAKTAKRDRPTPPVSTYKVPSVIPREGAPYTIRWGDTLWDISEAFYRNPWLYPRIARFNNIRNPDLIISGTTIRVPPRN